MLAYGHQARGASSGDLDGGRALSFAVMGYPPPYSADWDQASAMVLADEARYLAAADLYVLTPQMLDVVIAAAQSLTFTDLSLLRDDDLPSPSGAVILPRPLLTRLPTGSLQQDIAFTWRSPWRLPLPGGIGFSGAELTAVRMSGYVTAARASREVVRAARAEGLAVPPMLLDTVWSLPLHPVTPGPGPRLRSACRRVGGSTRRTGKTKHAGTPPPTRPSRQANTHRARYWTKTRTARSAPIPVRVLAAVRTGDSRRAGRPHRPQRPGDRRQSRSAAGRAGCRTAPGRIP